MLSTRLARAMAAAWVVCACAVNAAAHDRPDFSGTWTADQAKSARTSSDGKTRKALMLGSEFTARQDATTLTLRITSGPLHVTAVYNLDGSESTNMSPGGAGQPDIAVVSRASWEGSKLVIRSTSTSQSDGKALTIESVRTMFLDTDGTLVIDRTGTPISEVPETRSVYTKVREPQAILISLPHCLIARLPYGRSLRGRTSRPTWPSPRRPRPQVSDGAYVRQCPPDQ